MGRVLVAAALAALVCGPQGAGAVTFLASAQTSGLAAARSAEWRGMLEAESEDRRFWATEWAGLEAELLSLRAVAANATSSAATNATNATNATSSTTSAGAKKAPAPAHKLHSRSPLAGLKLNLEPKTPQDLVPALAMLKGLYEDGKDRIAKLNVREKQSKLKFDEKLAAHNERLATIEARFKNHTLSAEFHTNETHDENRLWNYWSHVRERQHKQFHTSLKIQHGTLEKVKTMMDMYEKTIAGKADKVQVAKQLAKVGGGALPEVVFLQESGRALASYCDEELTVVRSQRAALLQAPKST